MNSTFNFSARKDSAENSNDELHILHAKFPQK